MKVIKKEPVYIEDNFIIVKDKPFYDLCKKNFDLIFTYLFIVILSPIFLFAILCIKIYSRGSIFYKHKAIGFRGKPFYVYKFRTMYDGCDKISHEVFLKNFINGNPYTIDNNGRKVFKVTNDSRIFPLGKFLRKTSIDELPQLFNVIRGEMSLVGPRPPVIPEFELYKDWHKVRTKVMPGITGYHQATGRSVDSFKKMFQKDLYYIRNRSFWFDLWIIFRTIYVVFSCRGAH